MILFIWSPSTFSHFANDRIHKNTLLLIKHIIDKEKIGNYLVLPSPGFSLCHFNSVVELLLSIIIPQTAVWERSLDQITFEVVSKLFEKNFFFHFSAARRVSTRSLQCRRVTTWKDLKTRSFNIASNTPQSCTQFRRN
jgi:hypothetical protein